MRLKKKSASTPDYLQNWPARYYEIEAAIQKRECLIKAMEQNLDPEHDPYRLKLLEKRFFRKDKKGNSDSFMLAWMMMKADSENTPLFRKKKQQEFTKYLKELCLIDYEPENEAEQQVLTEEWTDFARRYLSSCAESRTYCSTFFGLVPIRDEAVARKIAEEIDLITKKYPASLGFPQALLPLRRIFVSTSCQMVEDGETYFS